MPPSSDTPLVDLSPRLDALLLHSLWWLLVSAILVAVATQWLSRRHQPVFERLRALVFGTPDGQHEPAARRFLRISFGVLWIIDGLLQVQSQMPSGFGPRMLAPGLAASPPWYSGLVAPIARVWTRHPVVADAASVWIQIGLGLLFLVGGRGLLNKLALWASVAWSILVWIAGEFVGGLLSPGASWLNGAPGAVALYVVGAVALTAPWRSWTTGAVGSFVRRAAATWFLLGAVLQAVPWERSWTAAGISEPFAHGASTAQPLLFRVPISHLARWAAAQPAVTNAVLISVLVVVGTGLWLRADRFFVGCGVVVCALTWWLAQDFGVLGGVATDPNSALPLGLLLICCSPGWQERTVTERESFSTPSTPRVARLLAPSAAALSALGIGALVVAPVVVAGLLLGPADSAAVAADSGGGVVALPHRPTPPFTLTDQNGRTISEADFQGKLTLVTFFDPVCSDECPLIANQLAIADRQLGALAGRVQIVAIDSNPVFHNVADVAAFTTSHGLNTLPNWHFLAGSVSDLQDLISAYGIVIQVPTVGMLAHGEGIYFIGEDGRQVAYLGDGANEALTHSYADTVRDEVRRLLA